MAPDLAAQVNIFGWVLVLAVVLGSAPPLLLARRAGYSAARVALALGVFSASAVLGAKLYSILERGLFRYPSQELSYGFRYPGAVIGMLIASPLVRLTLPAGLSLWRLGDFVAPGVCFAMVAERINCILVGCCSGGLCTRWWCVGFPRFSPVWESQLASGSIDGHAVYSHPVHPLQVYFLLASLAVGVVLVRRSGKTKFDGENLLLFLVLHEGAKAALEWLRDPYEMTLQVLALSGAVLGAVIWFLRRAQIQTPSATVGPQVDAAAPSR